MIYNFQKVFAIFRKEFSSIPLEIFKKNHFKILISTILSSRTKDEITLAASKRLFKKAPNIRLLRKLNIKILRKLIYPVGFYNTKAKQLKKLAKEIDEKYDGKIPDSRRELMKLPGVGRKTANLVLNLAFSKPAIAADTHVHRISNLLGWVKTKTPEETEKELTKILPKKYWKDINRLFVSIGRQYSTDKKLKEFLKYHKLLQ